MKTLCLAIVFLALPAAAAAAQENHPGTDAAPSAGMEQRAVKALSGQQVEDLRAGRGMGLALAAELNGYPGPAHVLELADKLELTSDQRSDGQKWLGEQEGEGQPC